MSPLVQVHEDCDECAVGVRSEPGHSVELFDRHSGRQLLLIRVASDEGCWLADALRRAFDHARGRPVDPESRVDGDQEVEDLLRHALRWALTWISSNQGGPPDDGDGEVYEDYSGATRLAWPDEPECWS